MVHSCGPPAHHPQYMCASCSGLQCKAYGELTEPLGKERGNKF